MPACPEGTTEALSFEYLRFFVMERSIMLRICPTGVRHVNETGKCLSRMAFQRRASVWPSQ